MCRRKQHILIQKQYSREQKAMQACNNCYAGLFFTKFNNKKEESMKRRVLILMTFLFNVLFVSCTSNEQTNRYFNY
jgi:hypothetical protein